MLNVGDTELFVFYEFSCLMCAEQSISAEKHFSRYVSHTNDGLGEDQLVASHTRARKVIWGTGWGSLEIGGL